MSLKRIATTATLLASVIATAFIARPASATSPINVTIENGGVQQSSLYTNPAAFGAINVKTETFDGITTGYHGSSFSTNVGTFDSALIMNPDIYGGAGGTGHYFDVDHNRDGSAQAANYTASTLTLNGSQRYLGLWWSAGDASNVLEFYSHGQLLETLTTQDVKNFTAANQEAYYGNPNTGNSKATRQDNWEPFAYLNFFANQGFSFDQVKFTNNSGTGFEADNFTVASDYGVHSGTQLVPESSNLIGLFVVAGIAVLSQGKRIAKKA
jgi:hypothetical protein